MLQSSIGTMSEHPTDHLETSSPEDSLHTQLNNFTSSRQWDRAKIVASELLSTQPESAWLHYQMGYILYQLDDQKNAEKHLKHAIAQQPDFADAYSQLASTYLAMGRTGTAEDNIRKALSIDPYDAHSWVILAHLTLHFEDPTTAIQHANKALEIDPTSSGAQDVIIRARGELKGSEKIPAQHRIEEFNQLLADNPEDHLTHSRIGDIYFEELKNYGNAEQHYRKALNLAPDDKTYQAQVIATLRKRDLFLRLLWLPFLPCQLIINFVSLIGDATSGDLKLKNLPVLLLAIPALLLVKPLIVILAVSFLLFGTIFWPLTKAYEYLTVADIHRKMGKITFYRGPLAKIHKLPFAARFAIFTLFVALFWTTIYFLLTNDTTSGPIIGTFAIIVTASFLLFVFAGLGISIYEYFTQKSRDKKTNN